MGGELVPDIVIAEISSLQEGVVARRQLVAAGLSHRQIDRRIAILVGDTSKGRKGTSHDTPQAIIQAAAADSDWDRRVQGGLASGEGVI